MKQYLLLAASAFLLQGCQTSKEDIKEQPLKMIEQIDFSHVKINDNFWSPRLSKHVSATLPVCIDQIENQTGRIRNFENAAKGEGEHSGIFFDDSDVYKALEGMAYSLINNPDPELEKKADEWIDKFAAAQQPDGYINTFYTLTGLDKRWTNMDKHEMYCAGHMIEAGVAYYQATGKRKLLDVCIRMTDHMMSQFGPGKRHWVPGHEEIELALVKLYQTTQEQKYLDFAYWLLEERGHGHGTMGDEGKWNPVYYQDIVPVRQLTDISGHAVRCMYLYCGMADVAALKNDTGYIAAMDRLWDDVVHRNMYITGGIGSSHDNEGFTEDYDLPNLDAYCETCASVGMVLWNQRMNQLTGDSKYIDVLERSLYNGALAGISLGGDRFFYVNPLESKGDHHRQEWYGCACCPSQLSRFLPSIGNYIYASSDDALWVNLYIGNTGQIRIGETDILLTQETDYPWDGSVKLTISTSQPLEKEIRLRIPNWCKTYDLSINGKRINVSEEKGYAVIKDWKSQDVIALDMDMPVEIVAADPHVKENFGKRAIQRGPLVYCMEEIDNPVYFDQIQLSPSTTFQTAFASDILNGIKTIKTNGRAQSATFIPY
ncbi:MAG TPA: glycoside hydrolase family 127 protein, partial [Parabacteroides distasonis]|nr:glycoside hydrolase family 127 protein [Parabacteroides distasonis]